MFPRRKTCSSSDQEALHYWESFCYLGQGEGFTQLFLILPSLLTQLKFQNMSLNNRNKLLTLLNISVSEFSETEYPREFVICFATLLVFSSEVDLMSEFKLPGAILLA